MVELCGMLIFAWLLLSIILFVGSISAVSVKKTKRSKFE